MIGVVSVRSVTATGLGLGLVAAIKKATGGHIFLP